MNSSIKDGKKLIKKALRNMPDLPFEVPFLTKRTSVMPYILGGIGVALMGAVAAVMIFSPRTRYRALGVAKDAYGKVQGQLQTMGVMTNHQNGISQGSDASYMSSSTGL
jgi:flagellar biosynthesis/type III secretory pathway M-ring protein FliF/YscJ